MSENRVWIEKLVIKKKTLTSTSLFVTSPEYPKLNSNCFFLNIFDSSHDASLFWKVTLRYFTQHKYSNKIVKLQFELYFSVLYALFLRTTKLLLQ